MTQPKMDLPSQIPVMVLPACNLLPHSLLPLYIFEPRYRQMLADALDGDRMFAIGTVDPTTGSADEPGVCEFSCAGLVRACVGSEDGTSHLVLQGLQRIRFTGWNQGRKPYRVADIAPVESVDRTPETSAALAERAVELAKESIARGTSAPSSKALEEIESIEEPEPLADLIAYHLIQAPDHRQALLGMEDVGERLRYVIRQLADTGPIFP